MGELEHVCDLSVPFFLYWNGIKRFLLSKSWYNEVDWGLSPTFSYLEFCWNLWATTAKAAGCDLLRFLSPAFLSAAFSAFSIRFLSSLLFASLSAVYSASNLDELLPLEQEPCTFIECFLGMLEGWRVIKIREGGLGILDGLQHSFVEHRLFLSLEFIRLFAADAVGRFCRSLLLGLLHVGFEHCQLWSRCVSELVIAAMRDVNCELESSPGWGDYWPGRLGWLMTIAVTVWLKLGLVAISIN